MDSESQFLEKARAHWTPERERKLTAGRRYPILPSEAALLLRHIGLLNGDGSMSADSVRKYQQINHMVTLLEPFFLDLSKRFSPVRLLDSGCGSSYLTFLLAWCFKHRWHATAQIVGVDSNAQLIEKCIKTAGATGLSDMLRFVTCNLRELEWDAMLAQSFGDGAVGRPNAVVALHACDVATDWALGVALSAKSDFIAVAPCCQAELARKLSEPGALAELAGSGLASLLGVPNLRRDAAAVVTDTLRLLLLRGSGYEVTATEFVASQHTAKNRLILAERRGNYWDPALAEYAALKKIVANVSITLEDRLPENVKSRLGLQGGP
jgi:SAM-dependent methyltransferase